MNTNNFEVFPNNSAANSTWSFMLLDANKNCIHDHAGSYTTKKSAQRAAKNMLAKLPEPEVAVAEVHTAKKAKKVEAVAEVHTTAKPKKVKKVEVAAAEVHEATKEGRKPRATMSLNLFADPGHGWLKVYRKDLVKYGIEKKISSYSYQRKDAVFLEEDNDLATFVAAVEATGTKVVITTWPTNKTSRIRGYESYSA